MNKVIKILLVLALALMFVIPTSLLVDAHTTKQSGTLRADHKVYGNWYIGSESVGWSIDEDYHNGGTTLYYKWKAVDYCLTAEHKTLFQQGAAKWAPCGNVKYDSSLAKGTFGTFDPGSKEPVVASFYDPEADSSGHLTAWKIDINWRKNATSVNIAHEIGHAYGLNDLYDDANSDKLMYGVTGGKAKGPTGADVRGF